MTRHSPILGLALLLKELLIPRFQPAKSLFDIFFDIEQLMNEIKNIIFGMILICLWNFSEILVKGNFKSKDFVWP